MEPWEFVSSSLSFLGLLRVVSLRSPKRSLLLPLELRADSPIPFSSIPLLIVVGRVRLSCFLAPRSLPSPRSHSPHPSSLSLPLPNALLRLLFRSQASWPYEDLEENLLTILEDLRSCGTVNNLDISKPTRESLNIPTSPSLLLSSTYSLPLYLPFKPHSSRSTTLAFSLLPRPSPFARSTSN